MPPLWAGWGVVVTVVPPPSAAKPLVRDLGYTVVVICHNQSPPLLLNSCVTVLPTHSQVLLWARPP